MQLKYQLQLGTHRYMQLQVPHNYKVDLPTVYTAAAVIKFGTVSPVMCMNYIAKKSLDQ